VWARTIQQACATAVAHQLGRSWPHIDAVFQVFLDDFQTCCKLMFQVFSNVSDVCFICFSVCCKSRPECCICCNGCTCMLQASISSVSFVFLHICYKYFRRMSQVFCLSFFCMLQVLHLDVSKSRSGCCTCCNGVSIVCSKYFIWFRCTPSVPK
jgi:hypothetical protein